MTPPMFRAPRPPRQRASEHRSRTNCPVLGELSGVARAARRQPPVFWTVPIRTRQCRSSQAQNEKHRTQVFGGVSHFASKKYNRRWHEATRHGAAPFCSGLVGEPFELDGPGPPAQPRGDRPGPQPRVPEPLGVGFLIGKGTEELIPLLSREKDFLELMLGPEKIRYIGMLKQPARAMCISESLESNPQDPINSWFVL
jgi:hypothetical protein